jgi:site-specific recombinase XerD
VGASSQRSEKLKEKEENHVIPQTIAKPIAINRQLTLEELKSLKLPMKIQGDLVIFEESLRGYRLQQSISVKIEKMLAAKEKGLIQYIINAFISDRPTLIPFVFDNQSILKMARHFLRHCSGSYDSCRSYIVQMHKYSTWLGHNPDLIIADLKPVGNIPDPTRVQNHTGYLNDYLAQLQDDGLKPGAVNNYIKSVKTFYRVNGVKIELSEPLSRRVTYKDRAPKPEELTKLLDIADLREKFIISAFALGGFREETFSKLTYRHIKEDLETNMVPLHIHIEAEITKGKYGDYDTFLGPEAVNYLKLYLDQRRQGNNDYRQDKNRRYLKPEELTDNSPLIRDASKNEVKGVTPKQIRKIIHDLYVQAGLIKPSMGRLYELRTHSIRKYFKTQMIALGVQEAYVDYMMGHIPDTYDDIQSLGIDKLRNIYSAAGLAIRPKTQHSKLETIKEMIRALGENPEQILTRDALAQGATTDKQDIGDHQLAVLRNQLRQLIKEESAV